MQRLNVERIKTCMCRGRRGKVVEWWSSRVVRCSLLGRVEGVTYVCGCAWIIFSARESVTATASVSHRPLPINPFRAGRLKLDDSHVIVGYTLYHLYL
jgi:hypothetical protein